MRDAGAYCKHCIVLGLCICVCYTRPCGRANPKPTMVTFTLTALTVNPRLWIWIMAGLYNLNTVLAVGALSLARTPLRDSQKKLHQGAVLVIVYVGTVLLLVQSLSSLATARCSARIAANTEALWGVTSNNIHIYGLLSWF